MLELQVSTIIFTIINLLILYVVLKKVLFGRVNQVLKERQELIHENLSGAEEKNAQADARKAEYEAKLAQARAEADGIVSQAQAGALRSTRPSSPRPRRTCAAFRLRPRPRTGRTGRRCFAPPAARWPSWR